MIIVINIVLIAERKFYARSDICARWTQKCTFIICTCEAVGTVLDGTLYGSNGGFGTATGYYCPYELSDKCPHIDADDCDECKNIEAVFEDTIDYINITEYEVIIGLKNTNLCVTIDEIGKTVFLTQAEAEQKLKELESGLYDD